MKQWKIILVLLAVLAGTPAGAQIRYTAEDSIKAENILKTLAAKQTLHSGEMMEQTALKMLGTPYVAGTLDQPGKETLTVYLTKTDCILLVETCFNLTLCAQRGESRFMNLCDRIRDSRYREGVVNCYADRIHYTTEWIWKEEQRGILKDMTADLGGIPYVNHPINYMGNHPDKYPLMDDVEAIKAVEEDLNMVPIDYIPKENIKTIEAEIKSGDIICFVTSVEGLDISHTAIAHVAGGKAGFIHASSLARKVIIDDKSIADFAASQKSCVGIKVVRMLEKPVPEKHTFQYDGRTREYLLYIPEETPNGCPLVMLLHGYGQQAEGYVPQMMDIAREEKFAVCYPVGRKNALGKRGWNVRYPQQADVKDDNDVALLLHLAELLQKEYGFNPGGTFLTGMSNGGDMCYLMAYEDQTVFSAIASVAGQTMKWRSDQGGPVRPIPFMEVHGTADRSARWDGDITGAYNWGAYLSVPDGTKVLADLCECQKEIVTRLPLRHPGARQVFMHRQIGSALAWGDGPACEVRIFEVKGGPHSWALDDLDTCREIWNFFKTYLH